MSKYMTPVHKRDVLRAVRDRWLNQYKSYKDDSVPTWDKRPIGEIRSAVKKLDPDTCTSKDVDKAIGTTGWGDNKCGECGEDRDVLLRLGQEPDYDARYWEICLPCLKKAVAFLSKIKAET
jgi:hypothetical protein